MATDANVLRSRKLTVRATAKTLTVCTMLLPWFLSGSCFASDHSDVAPSQTPGIASTAEFDTLSKMATTLVDQGHDEIWHSKYDSGLKALTKSITIVDQGLRICPGNIKLIHLKQEARLNQCNCYLWLWQTKNLQTSVSDAISECDTFLAEHPGDLKSLTNKDRLLIHRALAHEHLGEYDQATEIYLKVRENADRILAKKPDNTDSMYLKSCAIGYMATTKRSRPSAADLRKSIKVCNEGLSLDPKNLEFLRLKPLILAGLSTVGLLDGNYEAAEKPLDEAQQVLSQAQHYYSDDIVMLLRQSLIYCHRAGIKLGQGKKEEANELYEKAMTADTKALQYAPADPIVMLDEETVLRSLAKLESNTIDAQTLLRKALAVADKIILQSPDCLFAFEAKGRAWADLAKFSRPSDPAKEECLRRSLACYDTVLATTTKRWLTYGDRARTQIALAVVLLSTERKATSEAQALLLDAKNSLNIAQKQNPMSYESYQRQIFQVDSLLKESGYKRPSHQPT